MALRVEIVPDKAVVARRGQTIVAASWFGGAAARPYVYPFLGPGDCELTRLGHPEDPVGHSHHRSIWIGHHDVSGSSFWEDGPAAGRIEASSTRLIEGEGARVSFVHECVWKTAAGKPLVLEKRTLTFFDLEQGELALEIDAELRPADAAGKVVLGDTPFGLLGIRVARTMRVAERLGGQVLNSQEAENEAGCHWQHAEWCDYSGPVYLPGPADPGKAGGKPGGLPASIAGIACFSHPSNAPGGTLWHVRDDGWMGPCISKGEPRPISNDAPLRARYRIESHRGRAEEASIGERYRRWRRS